MKLTFFLLLSFLHVSAAVHSQDRVSLDLQAADLRKVLLMIEAQTKYHFIFSERKVCIDKKIDLSVKDETVFKVLESVLPQANLEYKLLEGNLIAITAKDETGNVVLKRDVRGTVTDTTGSPLPGVTIAVKEAPSIGTTTDLSGKYVLDLPDNATTLIYSMIGYDRQEIPVNGREVINVQLAVASNQLEETVIVGFGKQKKKEVVGAVTTINPKELKVPSSNLTTALAGRLSGVIAYQRSGEPGADNADFFIRGVTSFGYSNRPLILIDGVEMTTTDLARMQADDIASFSIMKDASATALYGARGANGVILVTTKEGKEGKSQISARYETSLSAPTRQIRLADPITYMKLHNESVLTRDPLGLEPYTQEKIESTQEGKNPLVYPAVDWHSMLFKDQTMNNRLNVNLSGGGKVARYYVAATYNKDNGILKVDKANNFNNNIDLKNYELRSNVNINLTNTTEAIVRLNAAWADYTGPITGGTQLYNMVMRTNPVLYPAYFPKTEQTKNVNHIMFGNHEEGQNINPYAEMVRGYKNYTKSMVMAQFELKQKLDFLIKGLHLRGTYNTTRYADFDVRRFYNPFYYNVSTFDRTTGQFALNAQNAASATEYLNYNEGANLITTNNYMDASLGYNATFSKDHSVSAMLVYMMRNRLIANAGSLQKSLPYRNMGLSGRFTYAYNDRYFLEANFGYNGSERFAENNRFGLFPSIGGGWYTSNEPFWTDGLKHIMPKLKFKATYGLVGNDAIGSADDRFFFLSQVNMDLPARAYTFGSDFGQTLNGVAVTRYENPDITWEMARKTNLGVELNLFNMVDINADFYHEHRSNILMDRAYIPSTMGLQSTPRANLGEAKSRGVDLSVDVQKHFRNGWWLFMRGNFTYATNEFSRYEEPDYSATPWMSRIGMSIDQVRGYVAERLFVDEKEVQNSPFQSVDAMAGDIKYKDINGDGMIDDLDQVFIGYPLTPEIVYGFGFSAGYKNVDVSCFFQGLARESFWLDYDKTAPFIDTDGDGGVKSYNALLQVYADSYWSEQNRDLYALWPRLSSVSNANNRMRSTWFMQNGAFLRLKSVEIGYTLPARWTKRVRFSKARLYVSGTNLLTFSKFKLWDPEMAGNGLGYPVQRVTNFGFQCSF